MPDTLYHGRCLCGAVRYQVAGEPRIVARCHCENCQRLSGAGHSTGAMFSNDGFQMTGDIGEYRLQSANGNEVTRAFCPACGSPIYGRNTSTPGFLTITLGTLDEPTEFHAQVAVFAANRKPWDVIDDDIATFDAQPAWTPDRNT